MSARVRRAVTVPKEALERRISRAKDEVMTHANCSYRWALNMGDMWFHNNNNPSVTK
jgi:hypothetical protein